MVVGVATHTQTDIRLSVQFQCWMGIRILTAGAIPYFNNGFVGITLLRRIRWNNAFMVMDLMGLSIWI
jgi:hypothetical protein